MAKITRLSAELANQIAAGEVVERPASVVKELVENALDAGARRITIAIELGGKKTIRVEDDGDGMSAADAPLALERHATSKLTSREDLGAIQTLGFRGEALPSIASVSRLALRTRERGAESGTEVRIDGGTQVSVREIGTPVGTVVEVGELFYNLPARRKFLKSDGAEASQVLRLVTQLALGHHQVGFTLTSAGRRVIECGPVGSVADRFYQIYGERADLVEVHKEVGRLRITGYVAAPGEHGPARGPQHVFVNGRNVKDKTLSHAILAAYGEATIKERRPEAHLFVELPPDRVDVNVHPTKAEVRFLEQSFVHEAVRRAIGDALGQAPPVELRSTARVPPRDGATAPLPGLVGERGGASRWAALTAPFAREATRGTPGPTPVPTVEPDVAGAGEFPLVPLGQFRDTFIVAVDDRGVAIIDQHVAHERVLYERVMERLAAGRLESQRLLVPLVVELSASQRAVLASHAAALERLGFEIEEFGGETVRVTAVPAVLGGAAQIQTIRALAEDLDGLDRGSPADAALARIAATTACHAAVKANDPLTPEKMRHIVEELGRTAYSTVCPHGRPVVLRLTREEIERGFLRA